MTYNPLIPVAADFMAISNTQIRANYQTINTVFAKNHVILNSTDPGNLQGMHSEVTLRAQAGDPTTTATQIALYNKLISGIATLFYRPSSNQTPIQMTYPSISVGLQSANPDVFLPQQYSFLAGPFVFFMGELNVADGTVITLTTTASAPAVSLKYVGLSMQALLSGDNTSACPTNIAGNQFTVRFPASSGTLHVSYIAIGV